MLTANKKVALSGQTKDATYNKEEWSKRISKIKSFVKCGLITYSDHALLQMKSRNISKKDIEIALTAYNSTIVQCHAVNTYGNNQDELVVILGKISTKSGRKPLHIVLAEHVSINGGITYIVVTSYVTDNTHFYASGRVIRN